MSLIDYTEVGHWGYWKALIRDLDLEDTFTDVWGTDPDSFEADEPEVTIIEETLEAANNEYMLLSDTSNPPSYRVFQINSTQSEKAESTVTVSDPDKIPADVGEYFVKAVAALNYDTANVSPQSAAENIREAVLSQNISLGVEYEYKRE